MYKVYQIADGMIVWKGNAVIGIKGMTLPEMFNDCDCYKLPGNAFDYALAPNQKFTDEQLAFINKSIFEWGEEDEPEVEDFEETERPGELTSEAEFELPDDDLPF